MMWKCSVVHFNFLIFLRFINCCQCNLNHTEKGLEKKLLDEFSTTDKTDTDPEEIFTTTNLPQSSNFEINETTTEIKGVFESETNKIHLPEERNSIDIFELTENSSEVIEAIVEEPENKNESNYLETANPNETTTEYVNEKTENLSHSDLLKKCRHYKNGDSFNLEKILGLWQVVYYKLPNKLKCFKLNIKPVRIKDQKRYMRVFGSFNDTVLWDNCFLEITSTEKENSTRRHFLQGTQGDKGVMENVIIDEEYCKNSTYLTLHRESGDQWLVIDKLLVMRDCENGNYVVFTRFPMQTQKTKIMDALKTFGENKPNGTMACDIEKSDKKYKKNHLHDVDH